MLMEASQCSATFETQLLLGNRFTDINVQTARSISLDDSSALDQLCGLGGQLAQSRGDEVLARFCDSCVRPFLPVHKCESAVLKA